jgi:hypothetical protein
VEDWSSPGVSCEETTEVNARSNNKFHRSLVSQTSKITVFEWIEGSYGLNLERCSTSVAGQRNLKACVLLLS